MKLGIDSGNYAVKICGEHGLMTFNSSIGEARQVNLQQVHGQDDMVFEYEGESGFAGSLAMFESEFGGSIMGSNKMHRDTKLRTLIGIHRYVSLYNLNETEFDIVVGQPIINHTYEDKERMKVMLRGSHTIKVNGVEKTFNINRAEIAAECASAYWSNAKSGLVRIIDIGSGTVNYSTVLDGRFIDKDSGTLDFGMNTNKTTNLNALSRGIVTHVLKKWKATDQVVIVGGIAETVQSNLKEYLPNIEVLYPIFNQQYVSPIFANAIAFYLIGVNVYE